MSRAPIDSVVWDPAIYPRSKWSTATIKRYVDALEAGEEFPPLILEKKTNRLLDGKHRLEAYKQAGWTEVPVEWHTVPEEMTPKRYAAMQSVRHGDRLSNGDLKALAVEECEPAPKDFDVKAFSRQMGVSECTIYRWVGHILSREREERRAKVLRLSRLGWTQNEIATLLGVDRTTVSKDVKNLHLQKNHILELAGQDIGHHELSRRFNLPPVLVEAILLEGLDDAERLERLDIGIRPYDVWNFPSCHDLMGDAHPGRIPGELVCHVLYFYTRQGDLVVDPMVGSGTTLDACLLMGRKCRGYEIENRHDRVDIEEHDLSDGWPETVEKASLVFWDPPYFSKMDQSTIGEEGYGEGSVSGLPPDEYLAWFRARFEELRRLVRPGTTLAFLMSDWDPDGAKSYADHPGVFLWDYADLLREAGWRLARRIQCPLSTQQVPPYTVQNYRERRRLARLGRDLLICKRTASG